VSNSYSVECFPRGANKHVRHRPIRFNTGSDLVLSLAGQIGPAGLSDSAADLLDFAGAIYQIERQFRGRQRTNPIEHVSLTIALRKPKAWTGKTLASVKRILQLLGNAVWDIELKSGLRAEIPTTDRSKPPRCTQVALFSGGMDSTCGAATCCSEADQTQLVGFYTRQMTLQEELAQSLGFKRLAQCRMQWKGKPGLTYSFYYRSFFFLCLAAAIAESWDVRRILQFENGVLATAVVPASGRTRNGSPSPRNRCREAYSPSGAVPAIASGTPTQHGTHSPPSSSSIEPACPTAAPHSGADLGMLPCLLAGSCQRERASARSAYRSQNLGRSQTQAPPSGLTCRHTRLRFFSGLATKFRSNRPQRW
jgi:hypothetical protein